MGRRVVFYLRYYAGLLLFIFVSIVGISLIMRSMRRDTQLLNRLLKVPVWLLFIIGVFLQVPTVIYIYLGIRAGFFSF